MIKNELTDHIISITKNTNLNELLGFAGDTNETTNYAEKKTEIKFVND